MYKKCAVILFLLLFSVVLYATPSFGRIVPNGHWAYEALYDLGLESGITVLSDRQPQSRGALHAYFLEINPEYLSMESQAVYAQLQTFFANDNFLFKKGWFAFDINGNFALQGQYLHNNELEPRADTFLRYNRTPSFISAPLEMMFSPYVDFYMNLDLKKNFWANEELYPYINVPFNADSFDMGFPFMGGLHIGNRFFSAMLGRGPLSIGKNLLGSMFVSDTIDRLDFFNLAFFMNKVRVDITIIEFEPTRFMFMHEVVFRPLTCLKFRLHEAVTLNSAFDPRYLNPMMIFHNWAAWRDVYLTDNNEETHEVGSQLGLEAEYIPLPGLRLYGQFVMNQFQTAYERQTAAEEAAKIPNSLGGLFGVEYQHNISIGRLTYTLEGMYGNPWLYIMDNKAISFYYSRKDNVSPYTSKEIATWIGNPYGPDSIAGIFRMRLEKYHKYHGEFSYRFVAKGENEKLFFKAYHYPTSAAEATIKTPYGSPTYLHTIALDGSYAFLPNLSLKGRVAWTIAHGKKTGHAVEISSALCYSIR